MSYFNVLGGVICVVLASAQDFAAAEMTSSCLSCLCEASTGCYRGAGCTDAGLCGMFRLSKDFWLDAGKPGSQEGTDDQTAFENCATEPFCASSILNEYFERHEKDCNGDSTINCDDYGRIMHLGLDQCDSDSYRGTRFDVIFSACRQTFW